MAELDDVRRLERLRIAAMLRADWSALADYLDEELIYVHSTGQVDSKASYLAALREQRWTYDAITVLDERYAIGRDVVVLSQRLSVRIRVGSQPATAPREAIASSVWRWSDGNWRLVLMQATPVS